MKSLIGILTVAAVIAPLYSSAAETAPSYPVLVGEAGVTDGDTIRMGEATITTEGQTKHLNGVRIRLHGIDAPEKRQVCKDAKNMNWFCGQDALMAMTAYVRAKQVTCYVHDVDRYQRLVSVCSVEGVADINAEMVKRGLAVAYREYSMDYVDEEETAREAQSGMWAGSFDMPWDWRKTQ